MLRAPAQTPQRKAGVHGPQLQPRVNRPARSSLAAARRGTVRTPVLRCRASAAPDNSDPSRAAHPGFLGSIFKSMSDYGIGKKSIIEGGVGLFVLAGSAAAVALIAWARGNAMRTGTPYKATIEFPLACGITIGTPVRIRGVQVGQVLAVKPSLERVDVLVEVNDVSTVIPRNCVIEANQSGLIAEPLVDITPQYTALPHEPRCAEEGLLVCDNGSIAGRQGVALDDLVYIMTRLARQAEADGVDKVFAAAESATALMAEARPLVATAAELVSELTPLLAELRGGGLVGNVEALSRTAADAAADIRRLQSAVLTEDNVRALRQAVLTLCKTLDHVESISSDVSLLARDSGVQRNLKTLVQALSRLLDE